MRAKKGEKSEFFQKSIEKQGLKIEKNGKHRRIQREKLVRTVYFVFRISTLCRSQEWVNKRCHVKRTDKGR